MCLAHSDMLCGSAYALCCSFFIAATPSMINTNNKSPFPSFKENMITQLNHRKATLTGKSKEQIIRLKSMKN